MHEPLKGAIALGAAGLLLLGGAGTYALWSDSVDLGGGTINSGQLEFVGTTAGVWRDASAGAPGTVIPNIANFLLVPGDVLTYSLTTTLRARGDNLEATLAAELPEATGGADLLADVDVDTTVTTDGGTLVTAITEANDGDVVGVVITLAFDEDSTNLSQLEMLDLSSLTLTVDQNPR